ncbi:ribose ABC transporter ATP-binding protein [Firmicutes bacterium CAG:791]|nr:ribose ABC transporter ATP-binding protein [Firmicutes bacterium CAG:791]
MAPMLEMKQITKRFPGVVALNNFSIDVRAGEVHALVGENGAGKSTLMKILYGVHHPDEGSIYLNGSRIVIKNETDALSKGIGVVFQELNVCPDLDVANNIFLGCIKNYHGVVDDRWTYRETKRILRETVKLDVNPATPMKYLSIAEQQMVEIAKVVSKGCKIVVFDEPTSSLTENEIVHLFKIIHQLKQQGVGIIYISHRLEELDQIADRVTVMRDGQHIRTMDYKDADTDTIVSLMVGREIADVYPIYQRKIGDVIFEANNIRYGNRLHVDHIDVRRGEILGVAGLVGAGRTETMRAIFGADPVDHMEITLDGREYRFRNPAEAINAGFIYMTEDRKHDGLALGLDVEANITLGSLKKFSNVGVMKDKLAVQNASDFCQKLHIRTPGTQQKVRYLSGGNQQKVILARWLTHEAKVLVLDEPTRGIDVGAKYEIYTLMNMLSDLGMGIIMISSDLPEIMGMSDRIAVFRGGNIATVMNVNETNSDEIMRYATGNL